MKYKRNVCFGLLGLFCCASLVALALRAQSAQPRHRPYVVISKTTVYRADPGKPEVVKDILRKTEARDSRGRRYSMPGAHVEPRFRYEWIRDVVGRRSYEVNRYLKTAHFTSLDPSHSPSPPQNSEMEKVEINGVQCLKGPARQGIPGGGYEVIGTTCVSFDLDYLLVHSDHRVKLGGEDLHIVTELENMEMDTEPPAEWFQIPSDFRLIPGTVGASKN